MFPEPKCEGFFAERESRNLAKSARDCNYSLAITKRVESLAKGEGNRLQMTAFQRYSLDFCEFTEHPGTRRNIALASGAFVLE